MSKGDELLSEKKFDEAIKTYESALLLAEVLGKSKIVKEKIERAKALENRETQASRLNELLAKADELMERREYSEAVRVLNEAFTIAKSINVEGKLEEKLDSLKMRMENLIAKGDSAFEGGNYTEALRLYSEALSIARALNTDTSKIEEKIKLTEEKQRLELLKESLKLDVPTEMPHKAESEFPYSSPTAFLRASPLPST
ncbi:hypothetical protein [Thermococcus cleftensis]|uniref:hypothetical protein n=1 Tax=Thermococcus cleftensis (strain DSM 27260 / KACC 17922 / CL1) TaxID=163003 RepID=UPI00064F6F3D|nr:hypothetical protein [Thermococcus cleftensis]